MVVDIILVGAVQWYNTFRIEFELTTVGTYTANVFADLKIPSCPYQIQVESTIDVILI